MSIIIDYTSDPYGPSLLSLTEKQAIGRVVVPVPFRNGIFEATVGNVKYILTPEQTRVCTSALQQLNAPQPSQTPSIDLRQRAIAQVDPYGFLQQPAPASPTILPQLRKDVGIQNLRVNIIKTTVKNDVEALERLQKIGPFTLVLSPTRQLPQIQFAFVSDQERLEAITICSRSGVRLARKDAAFQTPDPIDPNDGYVLNLSHPQSCTFLGLDETNGKIVLEQLMVRQQAIRSEAIDIIKNQTTPKSSISIKTDYNYETCSIELGNNEKILIDYDKSSVPLKIEMRKVSYPDAAALYGQPNTIWKETIPNKEAKNFIESLKSAFTAKGF